MRPLVQNQATLQQYTTLVATALYGFVRLNRAYAGPLLRVRRASDNAELDCNYPSQIAAHCAGTNGFVVTIYDQSGTNNFTQATAAAQAKIFDSATGLVLSTSTTPTMAMQQDGTDDFFAGVGAAPPTGDISLSWFSAQAFTSTTGAPIPYQYGSGTVNNAFRARLNTSPSWAAETQPGTRTFTTVNITLWHSMAIRRVAGDTVSAYTARQDGVDMVQSAVVLGGTTCNIDLGRVRWGCGLSSLGVEAAFAAQKANLLALYNANVVADNLLAVERILATNT
jgi:hypothetical protein